MPFTCYKAMKKLTTDELNIVKPMIEAGGEQYRYLLKEVSDVAVEQMKDGKMGSLHFSYSNLDVDSRKLGQKIAEAEFIDDDGITVNICLNLDDKGLLFELDVWKVDFSELQRWPKSDELSYVQLY